MIGTWVKAEFDAVDDVFLVDYAGHPFQYDLSCELGARGRSVVHTYSASTLSPHAGFEHSINVDVAPVDIGHPFERYRPVRRLLDELRYGWSTIRLGRRRRVGTVVTSNVPLVSLTMMWVWCRITRRRWVLWLQDFQAGLAAMATGGASPIPRALGVLERFLIRRADHVVVISDDFAQQVAEIGVDASRIATIENWAPLSTMPAMPRANAWAVEHELVDTFVFLYAGTMGRKHSPELLLELAREFEDDDDVLVVVVGEGPGSDWLARQPGPRPTQFPFQPYERLPEVLGSGDVLVTLLDPSAGAFSVPSKTLSYLCAGRVILGALPAENAAASVIVERSGAGIVVDPGDVAGFRAAARSLMEDEPFRSSAGRQAREYAQVNFERALIADRFERILTIEREIRGNRP